MGKTILSVMALVLVACGSDPEPPSCFQAMSAYYGAGCAFQNLQTGQQISQQQATSDCQSEAGSIAPACDDELDAWLTCLSETSPAEQCDCSVEQMAYIRC